MNRNEALLFLWRFSAVIIFGISAHAAFSYYYIVDSHDTSLVESFLGYNCTSSTSTTTTSSSSSSSSSTNSNSNSVSTSSLNNNNNNNSNNNNTSANFLCNEMFRTKFSLYDIHADNFVFPYKTICGEKRNKRLALEWHNNNNYNNNNNRYNVTTNIMVDTNDELLYGNIGNCNQVTLTATWGIAICSWIASWIALFWLTVYETTTKVYIQWTIVVSICSAMCLIMYTTSIYPSRNEIGAEDENYCSTSSSSSSSHQTSESSSTSCEERLGPGFYTQLTSCLYSFLICSVWTILHYCMERKQKKLLVLEQQKQKRADGGQIIKQGRSSSSSSSYDEEKDDDQHQKRHQQQQHQDQDQPDVDDHQEIIIKRESTCSYDEKKDNDGDGDNDELFIGDSAEEKQLDTILTTVSLSVGGRGGGGGAAAAARATTTTSSTARVADSDCSDSNNIDQLHVIPFYKDIHFWIKFGRMWEFALMVPAIFSSFANLTVVNQNGNTLITRILLWDGVFCKDTLLWLYLFMNTGDGNNNNNNNNNNIDDMAFDSAIPTFGSCNGSAMFHIQFASIKVIITAGMALVLKRDSRRNPMFYLVGIIMDFLSLVFICVAIGVFLGDVYPGRAAIQPPYCYIWTDDMSNNNKTTHYDPVNGNTETCNITLGLGFYLYCIVLVLTTVNFIGEFVIAEPASNKSNLSYGAKNAWNTVFGRVREGRIKSAIIKPSSCWVEPINEEINQ